MGEFGPMRIPTSQDFIGALIKRFNIRTSKFQVDTPDRTWQLLLLKQSPAFQTDQSYSFLYHRGEKMPRATIFKSPQGRQHFYGQYQIPSNETSKSPQDFMVEALLICSANTDLRHVGTLSERKSSLRSP